MHAKGCSTKAINSAGYFQLRSFDVTVDFTAKGEVALCRYNGLCRVADYAGSLLSKITVG
jgi:hypothetical protein